jgi:hypothetical protein
LKLRDLRGDQAQKMSLSPSGREGSAKTVRHALALVALLTGATLLPSPAAPAATGTRLDMPGFRPRADWVREMKRYGILPGDLDPAAPIDCYATEQKYWQSLWYNPGSTL